MICDFRFHRWGDAESFVNAAKIVVHEMDCDRCAESTRTMDLSVLHRWKIENLFRTRGKSAPRFSTTSGQALGFLRRVFR